MTEPDRPSPYHFRSSSSKVVHGSTSIIHRRKPGRDQETAGTNWSQRLSGPPRLAPSTHSWWATPAAHSEIPFFSSLLFPTNARCCYRASRLVLTQRANWSQPGPGHWRFCARPAQCQQPPSPSTLHSTHGAATQPLYCPSLATIPASSPSSSPSLNEETSAAPSPLVPVRLYCRPTFS